MKIISYSLFGYGKPDVHGCFSFNSYLRGLMINIRMNRLIFPQWITRVHMDVKTYEAYKPLFDDLNQFDWFQFTLCDEAELCKAMLWRMKPLFDEDVELVLCRDTDSPATYKEALCVTYWMNKGKAAHAITDSVSHCLPMLGGMVGFVRAWFKDYTGFSSWEQMVEGKSINYNNKGADQDLLNRYVYPCFAKHGTDSITQHYLKGMPNTFLSDYHTEAPEYIETGLSNDMKESNDTCGHIGSAGAYMGAMHKFLNKHKYRFEDIRKAEEPYKDIFYWLNDNSF